MPINVLGLDYIAWRSADSAPYLPVSHTSRTNDQDSLLNLLLTIGIFGTRSISVAERLVNCSHWGE